MINSTLEATALINHTLVGWLKYRNSPHNPAQLS